MQNGVSEMKKQILTLAAVGIEVCCLGACTPKGDNSKYDALNTMLNASYSQLDVTVTDKFDENTILKSVYKVTYSGGGITVEYEVEKFNELSLGSPASMGIKTTLKGVATIQGCMISYEGDRVDLNVPAGNPIEGAEPWSLLKFKKAYFKNAVLTDEFLVADVADPSGFLRTEISCTNMKVQATFLDVFDEIQIIYTSSGGNQVKYEYVFTR